ncbi:hypothetical protein EN859_022910 [Mesorhizobium sp. M00.F.Ca.ET.216.01.1.1]|nr:hypothetical protein EN859_022910 [Mesorhizobium sp. M00.F.Ca.ET.216.01.1.1]TIS89746.1 MAG: hypothetical protein E5W89_14610 [Mesorhizobium sp.]TJW07546.1 MAG: hypothetical protein E5W82_22790 [Mesorhizobium sp.]
MFGFPLRAAPTNDPARGSWIRIENERSGLLWRLMRSCQYIRSGLQRAGFEGGWLKQFEPGSTPAA